MHTCVPCVLAPRFPYSYCITHYALPVNGLSLGLSIHRLAYIVKFFDTGIRVRGYLALLRVYSTAALDAVTFLEGHAMGRLV
jgi:hypothetical protein